MLSYFKCFLFLACIPVFFASCDKDDEDSYRDVIVDFQDAAFPDGLKYNNNAGSSGVFVMNDVVSLENNYFLDGNWWYGFALSQMHDTETEGYSNQYSVYDLNKDLDNKFALGYVSEYNSPTITITFSQPVRDISFDIANSSYAALAMKNGAPPAKIFGKDDWCTLLVRFYGTGSKPLTVDTKGEKTKLEVPLAKGLEIYDTWQKISTTGDIEITKIEFSMQSSDSGLYMNTPSYFCLDNLKFKVLK